MARHVRKGDEVGVICGKFRGQTGKVLEVLVDKNRVRVEGVAPIRRHLKPGRDPKVPNGGIVERLGSIHISNVLPLDPKDRRPTRVGHVMDAEGKHKVRVARRSGQPLASPVQGR